jgi:hypothetical protein
MTTFDDRNQKKRQDSPSSASSSDNSDSGGNENSDSGDQPKLPRIDTQEAQKAELENNRSNNSSDLPDFFKQEETSELIPPVADQEARQLAHDFYKPDSSQQDKRDRSEGSDLEKKTDK